jgi:hypothetical protein
MLTLAHPAPETPGSDTPDLTALADLLRSAITALEAYAQRDLAVEAIYQAGRDDERALLTAAVSP